jgi:hypothetical protein
MEREAGNERIVKVIEDLILELFLSIVHKRKPKQMILLRRWGVSAVHNGILKV